MHLVETKGILSAGNSMNIYRGCQHGCIYCDARSRCYQMDHGFEDTEVKINAPKLLERALKAKRKPCMIGTGSMSDPYIPLETELQMTRSALERIEQYGFGVTMITKSDRILRDMDLLKRINGKTKAVVQMTLPGGGAERISACQDPYRGVDVSDSSLSERYRGKHPWYCEGLCRCRGQGNYPFRHGTDPSGR